MNKMIKKVTVVFSVFSLLFAFAGCGKTDSQIGETATDKNGNTVVEQSTTQAETPDTTSPYKTTDKLIALTFDDGPRASTTERILDTLEKNHSKATFFVVGYNVEDNLATINRARSMGCEIGSHTMDHKILTKCNSDTIHSQINKLDSLLQEKTGESPALFRTPGGAYKGITNELGKPNILWSIDTNDWRYKDASHKGRSDSERNEDLNRIANKVFEDACAGDIVLMHDIYDFSADLAAIVIPGLTQRGFKLVTVDEMFAAYHQTLDIGQIYYNADPAADNTVAVAKGTYHVATNGSVLLLRSEPSFDSEKLERIPNGETIDVIDSKPGWAYTTYNGKQGWVNAAYIKQ